MGCLKAPSKRGFFTIISVFKAHIELFGFRPAAKKDAVFPRPDYSTSYK
jgi:hypothetical protein